MTDSDEPEPSAAEDEGAPRRSHRADGDRTERRWAFILMATTTAVAVVVVGLVGIRRSNGLISYAIDDAYIHLALARNLGTHGTWGVVAGHYESASSSPGWTLLLAPLTWLPEPLVAWLPLLANLGAATWLLWQVAGLGPVRAARAGEGPARWAWALYPIAVGLVPLVLIGMEHTLHAAVVVALVIAIGGLVAANRPPSTRALVGIAALALVGTALRPETAFVAVGAGLALWTVGRDTLDVRTRAVTTAVLGAAAALPLAIAAVVNVAFGQELLPNSVVAKTALGGRGVLDRLWDNVTEDPLLVGVALVGLLALARRPGQAAAAQLTMMLTATGLHLVLADVGWMQRYQAYLIIGLSIGLIEALPAVVPTRRVAGVAAVTLVLALAPRLALTANTVVAMSNVANVQARMAAILAEVAPGRSVAVNDLGWVAWRHEGPVVDLAGLGSHEVLELTRAGELDRDRVGALLDREGTVAMAIYADFFDAVVPAGWILVAETCVNERAFVLSAPCVSWYAPDADAAEALGAGIEREAARWGDAMTVRRPPAGR